MQLQLLLQHSAPCRTFSRASDVSCLPAMLACQAMRLGSRHNTSIGSHWKFWEDTPCTLGQVSMPLNHSVKRGVRRGRRPSAGALPEGAKGCAEQKDWDFTSVSWVRIAQKLLVPLRQAHFGQPVQKGNRASLQIWKWEQKICVSLFYLLMAPITILLHRKLSITSLAHISPGLSK